MALSRCCGCRGRGPRRAGARRTAAAVGVDPGPEHAQGHGERALLGAGERAPAVPQQDRALAVARHRRRARQSARASKLRAVVVGEARTPRRSGRGTPPWSPRPRRRGARTASRRARRCAARRRRRRRRASGRSPGPCARPEGLRVRSSRRSSRRTGSGPRSSRALRTSLPRSVAHRDGPGRASGRCTPGSSRAPASGSSPSKLPKTPPSSSSGNGPPASIRSTVSRGLGRQVVERDGRARRTRVGGGRTCDVVAVGVTGTGSSSASSRRPGPTRAGRR